MFTADVLFFLFCQGICKPHNLIAAKFCTMISSRPTFMMQVENFGGLPPKILGAKNMQNLVRFWTTSKFDGKYLRNG